MKYDVQLAQILFASSHCHLRYHMVWGIHRGKVGQLLLKVSLKILLQSTRQELSRALMWNLHMPEIACFTQAQPRDGCPILANKAAVQCDLTWCTHSGTTVTVLTFVGLPVCSSVLQAA